MQMPMEMPMSLDKIFSQAEEMTSMGDTKTGDGEEHKKGSGQACQQMSSMMDMEKIGQVAEVAEQLAPLAMML